MMPSSFQLPVIHYSQKMSEYERQHRRPDAYERSEHHTVRPRRYAHRRHVSDLTLALCRDRVNSPQEEEDCSQPAPVSIPKLAAEVCTDVYTMR